MTSFASSAAPRCLPLLATLALAGCGGGGISSTAATVTPLALQSIGASGGTVTISDPASPLAGTTVTVPAGALSAPTTITIGQVTGDSAVPANAYEFALGPSGTQFAAPVTVTLKYSQQYLSANGITDPTTLKVVSMDPGVASATLPTTAQDTAQSTISAQTTHFSNFVALGYTNATLSGRYRFKDYFFNPSATSAAIVPFSVPNTPYSNNLSVPIQNNGFTSETGMVSFDGAGHLTVSSTSNQDGVAGSGSDSGSYSVTPDGTVTLPGGLSGRVLAGGSVLIFSAVTGDPEIGFAIKDGGASFSTASLSGSYRFADYFVSVSVTNPVIVPYSVPSTPYSNNLTVPIRNSGFTDEIGSVTFDGSGSLSLTSSVNQDGVAGSGSDSGSGSYSVSADGSVTLPGGLSGNLLAGGDVFVFSSTSGDPEIGLAVKAGGSGFNNASLKGRYGFRDYFVSASATNPVIVPFSVPSTPYSTNLTVPITNHGFTAEAGTVDFDGVGSLSVSTTSNQDGTSSQSTDSGSYSVNADGSVALPGGLSGQLLPGGSAFIFVSTSGDPEIGVAVLQ